MSKTNTPGKPYYITTPIYYVNDKPHIGHAYTSIASDILARFMRLDGRDVIFLTGTDEHGQKIERTAEKLGKTPKELVDENSQNFRDLSPKFKLSNDDFIRTTEPRHIKAAQTLWQKLYDGDEIYLGKYAGWYAVRDEAFYQESELVDGKAPSGADVEWVEEPSYFFRLSKWQQPLLEYYQNNPEFIGPDSRRNEVLRFVEGGLQDLSLSRTTFTWGVPVPNEPQHIMYVWFEALVNYLTALGFPDDSARVEKYWPQSLHIMGKDILRFHAVYWPAFLMAAGMTPPKRVYAHGWWTNEGQKISKSLGNAIDPIALIDTYGIDQIRYFLIREVPFGRDGDFSKTALINRMNSDLANSYGNLAQRVLSFIHKNCDERIPEPGEMTNEDKTLLNKGIEFFPILQDLVEHQTLHKMCEGIWQIIFDANKYIDDQKPWTMRKDNPGRMATVLYVLTDTIRQIAMLTQPIMPDSSTKILDQVGVPENERSFAFLAQHLKPGTVLPKPEGVFPRVEEA